MNVIYISSILIISFLLFLTGNTYALSEGIDTNSFVTNQILSCPTDSTVSIRAVPKKIFQIYFEYGTVPSLYANQSETVTSSANVPVKIVLHNLLPNMRYYYRIRYKEIGAAQFAAGDQCTFMTRRLRGSTYKFTLTADSHLYDKKGIPSMMRVTMQNILNDKPDFDMELGDTFGDDHTPLITTQQDMMRLHLDYMSYIGMVCHSSPFFFCLGNHEGESGYYLLQTPPNNIGIYGTLARKYYYSNPIPNFFYTGNTTVESYGIGQPENYYAWEWGDALFVVLDVYRYSVANEKPGGWDWTLGTQQYNWFKQILENSNARYKFVFAHHVRGQGRGAINLARYFEWGGYESDGTTWGFTTNRPGWALPVHQLMVKNHVNIFFQGHDHLFAQEVLDGLVYQEIPMPADSSYMIGYLANADAYTSNQLNGTGHLRVTVSPKTAKVEYVLAYLPQDTNSTRHNEAVAFSYSVNSNVSDVRQENDAVPVSIQLQQNYPNPFNPGTDIKYIISEAGHVILKVFDILGREIATLVDEYKQPGSYVSNFSLNSSLPTGTYFYQLRMNNTIITKKAILIK